MYVVNENKCEQSKFVNIHLSALLYRKYNFTKRELKTYFKLCNIDAVIVYELYVGILQHNYYIYHETKLKCQKNDQERVPMNTYD